ncbi:hypothetical protein [Natrinema salaciae]|uniref:Uncharacterized protein n=1 Tax=Natrinema salaciae TaxID=1186196 RepID=A0A1H8ZVJ0_9EURY|nr:hypothetical protein [Natrinema salaciae]SEP68267.1 hypothetical protein SAMN04489841_0271 [Natrinema salaciae]
MTADARETVRTFLDDRPDGERALEAALAVDAEHETWTLDDVALTRERSVSPSRAASSRTSMCVSRCESSFGGYGEFVDDSGEGGVVSDHLIFI